MHGYLCPVFLAEEGAVSGVVKVSMGCQNQLEVPGGAAGVFKLFFEVFAVGRVARVDENMALIGLCEVASYVREVMESKNLDLLHVSHYIYRRI